MTLAIPSHGNSDRHAKSPGWTAQARRIRHVDDCLGHYLDRSDADLEQAIAYAEQLGNGAVFKRLGFLLARRGGSERWLVACAERLTAGNARLDPTAPCPRLVRRWRVWMPESWKERRAS